jgi:hypothetical protein
MIEKKLKPYVQVHPPRERLAFLLSQLSELDPDQEKRLKLEPRPARNLIVEAMPAKRSEKRPKPDSKPVRSLNKRVKADPKSGMIAARKPAKKVKPAPDPDASSFQSVLRDCMKRQSKVNPKEERARPASGPWLDLAPRGPLSGLIRLWSWLHSKYTRGATKRLRLSEVVSLGDKRFVAIVRVEDREFLIGGAASGLSVLAQLGKASEAAAGRKSGNDLEGRSH